MEVNGRHAWRGLPILCKRTLCPVAPVCYDVEKSGGLTNAPRRKDSRVEGVAAENTTGFQRIAQPTGAVVPAYRIPGKMGVCFRPGRGPIGPPVGNGAASTFGYAESGVDVMTKESMVKLHEGTSSRWPRGGHGEHKGKKCAGYSALGEKPIITGLHRLTWSMVDQAA